MSAIATPSVQTLVKKSDKASGTVQTVAKKTTKNKATVPNNVAVQAKPLMKKTPAKIVAKTADRRTIEANKDAKTKAKNATRKANAVAIQPQKREYGLDDERAAELKKEKSHNAYREGSSYWAVVESLFTLGIGKMHSADKLVVEYAKQIDKDSFKAFKGKENRNEATGLGWKERIMQNAYVTTRQDYGKRMRDIGWEVRYEKTADGATYGLFRLNGKGK